MRVKSIPQETQGLSLNNKKNPLRERDADLSKLQHGKFARISQVEWTNMLTLHQPHQTINLHTKPSSNTVKPSPIIVLCSAMWMTFLQG